MLFKIAKVKALWEDTLQGGARALPDPSPFDELDLPGGEVVGEWRRRCISGG
jgi:hypothetical protein